MRGGDEAPDCQRYKLSPLGRGGNLTPPRQRALRALPSLEAVSLVETLPRLRPRLIRAWATSSRGVQAASFAAASFGDEMLESASIGAASFAARQPRPRQSRSTPPHSKTWRQSSSTPGNGFAAAVSPDLRRIGHWASHLAAGGGRRIASRLRPRSSSFVCCHTRAAER